MDRTEKNGPETNLETIGKHRVESSDLQGWACREDDDAMAATHETSSEMPDLGIIRAGFLEKGKSGGSFLQQILIGMTGSLQASTPYLGGFLGVIIVMWINAANRCVNALVFGYNLVIIKQGDDAFITLYMK